MRQLSDIFQRGLVLGALECDPTYLNCRAGAVIFGLSTQKLSNMLERATFSWGQPIVHTE
jgi:hypothetical protein